MTQLMESPETRAVQLTGGPVFGVHYNAYCLAVVSNLVKDPRINLIFDPLSSIILTQQHIQTEQTFYTSPKLRW